MTAFDDITNQHDIDEIEENNPDEEIKTPEDQDDDFIEGGEKNTDIDKLHEEAYGDEDDLPIDKEIDKDEIGRIKDLNQKQQKGK